MINPAASGQQPAFIVVGKDSAARGIAVRARAGGGPGLFWLGGFNSDMQGTKALALDAWAAEHNRGCHRALAGRERHGVRAVLCRAAGRDRLIDGRLDGAIAGA